MIGSRERPKIAAHYDNVAAQSGRRIIFADLLARRAASTRTPRPEGRGVDQLGR
jgi:hypothetical protein